MRKGLLILLALLFIAARAKAQSDPLIVNVEGRRTISLDGRWKAIVDPYGIGEEQKYFRDAHQRTASDLIEYNFDTADWLDVPGDWNSQRERLFLYEGAVWYRRLFNYQRSAGKRLFVYFGAANYIADVYLNGERIGRHEGGFTPFNFEITDRVRDGSNSLIVRVDNRRLREGVPTLVTDWWNYGGLTRSVALVEVPETFIQDYFIQLQKGTRDRIAGWVKLNGKRLVQRVTIRIPELNLSQAVNTDANGYAAFSFQAKLDLWTPENPKLYDVQLVAETDSVTDQIGFRSIEVRGTDILLNGRPVFMRGICLHEEAPFRSGRAFSREEARTLLGWAKELGCNFVRLAHYPHNEQMVREADRMGLLVWAEVPVYWGIQWESRETLANALNQLTEEITRDKNRAAIAIWSVANETPQSAARLRFLRSLIERARELDPTRLVSAAMLPRRPAEDIYVIDDPLGQYVDVLGCNEYVGWYDGLPEKADRVQWQIAYQKPLIISEFGAGAVYGLHGDRLTRWTEEYQEEVYRHQIGLLRRIPLLRGVSPWILMDFRSPRRPLVGIQDFYNRKGVISNRGEKKKAFYVLREFYRELQERSGANVR